LIYAEAYKTKEEKKSDDRQVYRKQKSHA